MVYRQRTTGLEPVQAELKSAMLHQLHHIRIRLCNTKNVRMGHISTYLRTNCKEFFHFLLVL